MKKISVFTLSTFLVAVALLIGVSNYHVARANPLVSATPVKTASATTSLSFMTPGTGTTTLTYDTFAVGGAIISTTKATYAALLTQFTATSTASAVNINIEYSDDGVDWYQDGGTSYNYSTTSKPYDLSQAASFRLNYASSTAGLGAIPASSTPATRLVILNTPLRYLRAIYTIPIGASNGAVWAQIVPTKERSE